MSVMRVLTILALVLISSGCDQVANVFAICPVPKGEGRSVPRWFLGPWVLEVKNPDEQYTAVWRVAEGDTGIAIFEETAQSVSIRRPIPVATAFVVKDRLVIEVADAARFGPDGSGVYVFKQVQSSGAPTLAGCYKFKTVTEAKGGKAQTETGEILEMKRATFGTLYEHTQQ